MDSQIKDYDIFIFDCDGVLMDVNLLKCEAFGKAVEGYPSETVKDFVNHCKKTFGVSRYVKFKEFFSDFAKEPFQETKYNNLLKKYSCLCRQLYSTANITPGCESLLNQLSSLNKKMYVASGSDEKELIKVFKTRGLDKYFSGIYGSPKTKSECTSIILNNNPTKRTVFIGDALSDLKTATEHGIDFIYMYKFTVQTKDQDEKCRNGAVKVINVLEDIL
ncbi:MAG: hypothetical protein K0S51_1451 [Bacillales bacterium]|jgi:HAD superfamily hydrolase (TIGR01549 family)|nr:hypothetical protein [Bacillales bacterium]